MSRFRLRLQDREIALPDVGEVAVGRDASCEVALEDRLASRRHAVFRTSDDGRLEIVDLESLNGVRVNDVPVKGSTAIGHRDRVQIGAHVFLVLDSRRERRNSAPTTRSAAARELSGGAPATRPVGRASRSSVTPLDTIASALDAGDVAAAAAAMEAVVARYADPAEPVPPRELGRVTSLLLVLAERTSQPAFFDRIFQIHTARGEVVDPAAVDAIQSALPRIRGVDDAAVNTYLESMRARAAALSTQDQVRLRRVATVARRIGGRGAPT